MKEYLMNISNENNFTKVQPNSSLACSTTKASLLQIKKDHIAYDWTIDEDKYHFNFVLSSKRNFDTKTF